MSKELWNYREQEENDKRDRAARAAAKAKRDAELEANVPGMPDMTVKEATRRRDEAMATWEAAKADVATALEAHRDYLRKRLHVDDPLGELERRRDHLAAVVREKTAGRAAGDAEELLRCLTDPAYRARSLPAVIDAMARAVAVADRLSAQLQEAASAHGDMDAQAAEVARITTERDAAIRSARAIHFAAIRDREADVRAWEAGDRSKPQPKAFPFVQFLPGMGYHPNPSVQLAHLREVLAHDRPPMPPEAEQIQQLDAAIEVERADRVRILEEREQVARERAEAEAEAEADRRRRERAREQQIKAELERDAREAEAKAIEQRRLAAAYEERMRQGKAPPPWDGKPARDGSPSRVESDRVAPAPSILPAAGDRSRV